VTNRLTPHSATALPDPAIESGTRAAPYRLDEQIGFLLRRANQRHLAIFAAGMGASTNGDERDLTPMQWAVLAKLDEEGATSQNRLGRLAAMDGATVKGVVDRLIERGLIEARADPDDRRRRIAALSPAGTRMVKCACAAASAITEETLRPLSAVERTTLLNLLQKLT
jgi:MarR family transcriptional regulator, lower aerobic nicotinate degradation pathway regulator